MKRLFLAMLALIGLVALGGCHHYIHHHGHHHYHCLDDGTNPGEANS